METVLAVLVWLVLLLGVLLVAIVMGSVALPPILRGAYNRWGATDEEVARALPGDDLVPDATSASTKAITIKAPYQLVHQLVVQMGYQRAGWYGWDWFYKATKSAGFVDGGYSRRIVPELQDLAVGDTVHINAMVGYNVVVNEPGQLLLFGAMAQDGSAVAADDPSAVSLMSWAWIAESVDEKTTRLILRIRNGGPGFGGFVDWLYANPLDLGGAIMAEKTLFGIRRVAEDLTSR